MRYEDAILIILTALAALLAALAIGIGLFAIAGYVAIRDGVKRSAREHVSREMAKTLEQYPTPEVLQSVVREMQERLEALSGLQKQLVTLPQSKLVANASNSEIKEEQAGEPEKPIELKSYPAQEATDASSRTAGGPPNNDPGPNPH